jgi:hypothetical protein
MIDRGGAAFAPSVLFAIAVVSGGGILAVLSRTATWVRADVVSFCTIVAGIFLWLMWIARPTFLPLGTGPDLTHHLLLIQYIERHWRLVHLRGVEDYLGEMVYYTPGSHILTALAGRWGGTTGFRALHAVMSAAVAFKCGVVYLIARRLLPSDVPRVPIAIVGTLTLFASQTYFLGSFAEYSFLAQVVAEWFAIAMWWALVAWDQQPARGWMGFVGLTGAAVFLTWPVLIGPPLVVLGALVLLPHRTPRVERLRHASVAAIPIAIVAGLFTYGRGQFLVIAGTGGKVPSPAVRAYGWWFLALSSLGIAIAMFKMVVRSGQVPVTGKPSGSGGESRTLAWFVVAIALQIAALYAVARWRSNVPYMALKMFYLLLPAQAVGVALAIGTLWRASFATFRMAALQSRASNGAWAAVAIVSVLVARPLLGAPQSLIVGHHPATSLALEQAGDWVRDHVPIKCVEYLVNDDETAYWLHLAVLGNPRQGPRTLDNATYELTPALVRWLTPGGLPYAIADLPALPADIRAELDIVQQFGTAAVVRRRGPSICEER